MLRSQIAADFRRPSPDYGRYRHRSPDYSRRSPDQGLYARRSPNRGRSPVRSYRHRDSASPDRDDYPREFTGRRPPAFLERGGRGRGEGASDSEDDEDLRGLPLMEYRRLKRQRLRKKLKNCIWRVTPSPPPGDRSFIDAEEDEDPMVTMSDVEKLNSSEVSDSESDDSGRRGRKKGKGKGKSRSLKSRRRRSSSYDSDSDEESGESDGSYSSSEEEALRKRKRSKKAGKKRGSHKRSRMDKIKAKRSSASSDDSKESERLSGESGKVSKKKSVRFEDDFGAAEEVKGGSMKMEGVVKSDIEREPVSVPEVLELQKIAAVLDDEDMVGPMPLPRAEGHISYGGALRPGEGDAIAQFVQQGKRIPRRGEVGLSADQIQKYEDLGYVMSGSRHQRMNAVRIRKENQVYSAEDKRALAAHNYEQQASRETKVMDDLRKLVDRHSRKDSVASLEERLGRIPEVAG